MKKLKTQDYIKGFAVAVLTTVLFTVQDLTDFILQNGYAEFEWKKILMAAISGGVGYLIKNFFTNKDA